MKPPLSNGFLRFAIAAVAAILALLLPSVAQALPEGYVYEKVSPADKGNGEIAGGQLRAGFRSAAEGDRVLYPADGVFAGATAFPQVNLFFGQRGNQSWGSKALSGIFPYIVPTGAASIPGVGDSAPLGYSEDGTRTLMHTNRDPATGEAMPAALHLIDLVTGSAERITPSPLAGGPEAVVAPGGTRSSIAGTHDFSTVLFSSNAQLVADALAPGIGATRPKLYRWEDGQIELATYLPDGTPHTGLLVDSVADGPEAPINGISDDGTAYWWTPGGANAPPRPNQLFRGEAGMTSGAFVNESENTGAVIPPGPAEFAGASSDGERALFTSLQPLTDDAASGRNVYLYTHSDDPETDENLLLISADSEPVDGSSAGVADVLGIDDAAQVVYFTATSQLVPGEPTSPGVKLYRWSATDGLEYLVTTGNIEPFPPGVTPDGRYVAFRSSGTGITADDNGGMQQVYLYDEVGGSFACASCVPGSANQSAVKPVQKYNFGHINAQARRMLSDDGRVIFEIADRLRPEDTNGKADVYTYKGGQLDLVSSGRATSDVRFADATADGSRIYFISRAQLSGWDTDAKADLYVARQGSGLPEPDLRPDPVCVGDDCQGSSPQAPEGEIGSTQYKGPGNVQRKDCSAARRSAKRARRAVRTSNESLRRAQQDARRTKDKAKRASGKQAKRLQRLAKRQGREVRGMKRQQRRLERKAKQDVGHLRACRGQS